MIQNGGKNEINSNDENDAWKMFDRQLCELGQDRWELVGVAPFGGFPSLRISQPFLSTVYARYRAHINI